jgi:anhydro-N-acetylmuramic acid kinase
MKQIKRFLEMASGKERWIIGLMSGTSADGVDCCVVRFTEVNKHWDWSLEGGSFLPYDSSFRAELLNVASPFGQVPDLCRLSFELGEKFSQSVLGLLRKTGIKSDRIALVVSHGHTVCHLPPTGGRMGSTLQVGEGAVIADRIGIPVLENLRVADVAAGGHGAPLVPAADRLLFSSSGKRVAIQNIGGIANITVLSPRELNEAPVAFDTGPGNMLIDIAISHITNGEKNYDANGSTGRRGKVSEALLAKMMGHPYLKLKPPKTTGREEFGSLYFEEIKAWSDTFNLGGEDLVATVTAFTAAAIAEAVNMYLPGSLSPQVFYVAGGGSRNLFLMDLLKKELFPIPVLSLDNFSGYSGKVKDLADMREALCFAALGNLYLSGERGTEISVTGASHNVCSGKLLFPPHFID